MSLLEVEHLSKTFTRRRKLFGRQGPAAPAVDDVSFTVEEGECLAVVGESGAGKSTLGRLVIRLIEPDEGAVRLAGMDIRSLNPRELRTAREHMQMVFQDPYSSLDPRMTIRACVAEPLLAHTPMSRTERDRRAAELIDTVGLSSRYLDRYPVELSGGQLQRVSIARAIALKPKLIVCDEPVTALDVSVRAQIINLLQDLRSEFNLTYLFVSHDLALVEIIADRVLVMRGGRVVETAPAASIFRDPQDAYTRELISATPNPIPPRRGQN
ncbi:ATP-binding cassette domain-containing protein [Arthrobacter sp. G119Y2]|uniref:ATP-binding cassette domain-containing protein n=1 Tax=Arthrobacter sp. G119Y2 TaxID=3134965 RepID=UPI003119C086